MALPPDLDQRIAGLAAMDQPIRRDIYRLLAERNDWITRDETAERVGVPRSVAVFHLDKLAEAGLVDVKFERIGGRQGPGAGRPSKLYRRRSEEVSASVPPRSYDLAGSLLLEAVAQADRTGVPVPQCLASVAHERGRQLGADASAAWRRGSPASGSAVAEVLERQGYEPLGPTSEEIALRNCPFHRLAEQNRPLVCGMNLEFIRGLIDGLGATGRLTARLAPEPGRCCVRITAA